MATSCGNIPLKFHSLARSPENNPLYPGFSPQTIILKQGTQVKPNALHIPCDILKHQDVEVELRDGTKIYVDIFLPEGMKSGLPTIISFTPFGKNGGFGRLAVDESPFRNGIPQRTVSGLEVFEGLDPAYWCNFGYAIVNADIRGTWRSQGDKYISSEQDGRDAYDLIEWIAQQSWSNQRVTMAGNSWLSQSQWFAAAECPPHLTCICPNEGWNDMYNDNTNRGGIPDPEFQEMLLTNAIAGSGRSEDIRAMCQEHPMWNDYYEFHKAKVEKINVPMYVVSTWTNFLHVRGTLRGFMESSKCENKWLRVHNRNEWPDLYFSESNEDLRRFLDFYMKDIQNGWEYTPRVRLAVLNPGHQDVVGRPESSFPLARQVSKRMFLNAQNASLAWDEPIGHVAHTRFSATNGEAHFRYTFESTTELTGFFSLNLFISSPSNAKDIDLFASLSKLSQTGEKLYHTCIDAGYLQPDPQAARNEAWQLKLDKDRRVDIFYAEGPHGRMRISHREIDPAISTPHWPRYTHKNYQPLKEGEIVQVIIELWPSGMIWEKGEQLLLRVAGHNLLPEGHPFLQPVQTLNAEGTEISIHTGGEFASHLLVPFIPS